MWKVLCMCFEVLQHILILKIVIPLMLVYKAVLKVIHR